MKETAILAPEMIACRWCGMPAQDDEPWWTLSPGRILHGGHGDDCPTCTIPVASGPRIPPTRVGTCQECRARHNAAERLAEELTLDQRRTFDGESTHRIAEVLRVLAIVGRPAPEPLTFDYAETVFWYARNALIRAGYPDAAASLEWADYRKAGRNNCAATPWSWLPERTVELLDRAVDAAGVELAAAEDPAVPLPPPRGKGCAFCGIATIAADPREVLRAGGLDEAARLLWHYRRPRWLCPECWATNPARGEESRDVARAALAAAGLLTAYESATHRVLLPAAPAWYRTMAPANRAPWAHLRKGWVAAARKAIEPPPEPNPDVAELARRVAWLEGSR
jgi:hypothetical protein